MTNSQSGGAAGKRGDRYELLWTIRSAVFPSLRGYADWVELEPTGSEADDAIEFRMSAGGRTEVHQAKRLHAQSNWTVNNMIAENILPRLGEHLADPNLVARFVSGTGAPELYSICERAPRFAHYDQLLSDLPKEQKPALDRLLHSWGLAPDETLERLKRLKVHLVDHLTLAQEASMRMGFLVEGDEMSAMELLAGFLVENMTRRLHARDFWGYLREHEHPPKEGMPNLALSERMRERSARYQQQVESTRPPQLLKIDRPEVGQIVDSLTSSAHPVVVLGPAGSGKSTVIAEAVDRLRGQGMSVATIRLDQLTPVATAVELGQQEAAGLGGSPAKALRSAAGESATRVLVVDQLDAFSVVSGQGEVMLEGLEEAILQVALSGGRVLLACRTYDYEHDHRISNLLSNFRPATDAEPLDPVEVPVSDLNDGLLATALTGLGVDSGSLGADLRQILRNPFYLSLLARIVADPEASGGSSGLSEIRTRSDLLRRVDERFAARLGDAEFADAIGRLVTRMSETGALSLPEIHAIADRPTFRSRLVHEGVLVLESGRYRFFHQAYFEYRFARSLVMNGQSAAAFLEGDPQDVMRRGQLRSVLVLERDADTDPSKYVADLRAIVFGGSVRTHLVAVALDSLAEHESPFDEEIEVLREVVSTGHDLLPRALMILARPTMARALEARGVVNRLVAEVIESDSQPEVWIAIDPRRRLWLLEQLARSVGAAVAEAEMGLLPVAAERPDIVSSILWAIFLAGGNSGDAPSILFVALCRVLADAVDAAMPDEPLVRGVRLVFSNEGVHALEKLATIDARSAVAALKAWLALAKAFTVARGGAYLFEPVDVDVLPHDLQGRHLLERMAHGASAEVVEALTPILLEAMEGSRLATPAQYQVGEPPLVVDRIWSHSSPNVRRIEEELLGTLTDGIVRISEAEPTAAVGTLSQLAGHKLLSAQIAVSAVLARTGADLATFALEWAARAEVRGVASIGSRGQGWGDVLANVVRVGSEQQRASATEVILTAYAEFDPHNLPEEPFESPESTGNYRLGMQQYYAGYRVALAWEELHLPVPEPLRERINLLAPVYGSPTGPTVSVLTGWGDPGPDVQLESDENWQDAVRSYYPGDGGGSIPFTFGWLNGKLRDATKADPLRFVALAGTFEGETRSRAAAAVLAGLAQATDLSSVDRPAIYEGLRVLANWSDRPDGAIAPVIDRLGRPVPADILKLLASIAIEPVVGGGDDLWIDDGGSGNDAEPLDESDKIQARTLDTIARIIAASPSGDEVELLIPAIDHLTQHGGPAASRHVPGALVRLHRHRPDETLALFRNWMDRAEGTLLVAADLNALAYRVFGQDHALAESVAIRQLDLSDHRLRNSGGYLGTHLAWLAGDLELAGNVGDRVRESMSNAAVRAGVAGALAELRDELLDDFGSGGTRLGLALLATLLDDEEEDVRRAASRSLQEFSGSLDRYEGFLHALAESSHLVANAYVLFYALKTQTERLPVSVLELLESWFVRAMSDENPQEAMGNSVAAIELLLDLHAHTSPLSSERARCLDLFDRMVVVGVDAEMLERQMDAAVE